MADVGNNGVALSVYRSRSNLPMGVAHHIMKLSSDLKLCQIRAAITPERSQRPLQLLWSLMLVLTLALSGCVESDLGVRFYSPNRGEILQQIQLSETLQKASGDSLQQWMRQLEQQVSAVGGSVQRPSRQALTITIPFTSSDELEAKFNQFLNGVFNPERVARETSLPVIESHLQVTHNNFLLVERDRLRYDIDLRSLGIASSSGNLLVSPASLIRLQFYLETPWGARTVGRPESLRPLSLQTGKKLVWNLIPGEQNTLETVFWMPNPLGIGAVVILGLVILGTILKYSQSSFAPSSGVSIQKSEVRSL
jgi:hypothetical protein